MSTLEYPSPAPPFARVLSSTLLASARLRPDVACRQLAGLQRSCGPHGVRSMQHATRAAHCNMQRGRHVASCNAQRVRHVASCNAGTLHRRALPVAGTSRASAGSSWWLVTVEGTSEPEAFLAALSSSTGSADALPTPGTGPDLAAERTAGCEVLINYAEVGAGTAAAAN